MMNDRQRLRRLNEALDASEAELALIEAELAANHDASELDRLRHRYNLAKAKANALQAVFDADFNLAPRKEAQGATR